MNKVMKTRNKALQVVAVILLWGKGKGTPEISGIAKDILFHLGTGAGNVADKLLVIDRAFGTVFFICLNISLHTVVFQAGNTTGR